MKPGVSASFVLDGLQPDSAYRYRFRWRASPDDFTAWPAYPPPGASGGERAARRQGVSS